MLLTVTRAEVALADMSQMWLTVWRALALEMTARPRECCLSSRQNLQVASPRNIEIAPQQAGRYARGSEGGKCRPTREVRTDPSGPQLPPRAEWPSGAASASAEHISSLEFV